MPQRRIQGVEKRTEQVEHLPQTYDSGMTNIIVALVINVVLGGVFGALWCIYDFSLRDYVLRNREAFDKAAV